MVQLPGLPDAAFEKADPSPDAEFYDFPRFVTHIDDAAIAAVTQIYRTLLPADGAILDVMSSWVSHLPVDVAYQEVVGHGMNAEELAANPRLTRWFVQDLNAEAGVGTGRWRVRRCLPVRFGAVFAAPRGCIPRGRAGAPGRCAVHRVVLEPLLSDEGGGDLAAADGTGTATSGRGVS